MSLTVPKFSSLGFGMLAAVRLLRDEAEARLVAIEGQTNWANTNKTAVRFASTANIVGTRSGSVLTVTATGALGAIDGVTPALGDRCLLKDQTTGADKGIYTVTSLGGVGLHATFTRAADADTSAELTSGSRVFVSEGTVSAGETYTLTTAAPITLNTTSQTWTKGVTAAALASTANGKGASTIGIEDAASKYTATNVEAALAEAKVLLDQAPGFQAGAATLSSGTITVNTGITVAANSEVIPIEIGAITGSANFASLRELKSSRVNGGPGVGTIVLEAVASDGAKDADAAGAIRFVILTPLV